MAWNFTQGFKIQDINPNMNLSKKKKKNIFSVVQLLVMVTKHMIESRNNS